MNTAIDLFGGNSDGSMRMEAWLGVMCRGCVNDRGRGPSGGLGGMSCELPHRALLDPYDAAMPEWSADAAPRPERLAELGPGPWPVCLSWRRRKTRSDAGRRRILASQLSLLDFDEGEENA